MLANAAASAEQLGRFKMHWSEWCLSPGDVVSVIGRVVEGVAPDGELGTYRSPPMTRSIVPFDGLPLLIIEGRDTRVLSRLARNKLDYPEWLGDFGLQ